MTHPSAGSSSIATAFFCACDEHQLEVMYRIVGFFEVLKFCSFCGYGEICKILEKPFCVFYLCAAEMIREIKMQKTENQASAEFKYLENNQLYDMQ